jgi:hypothetical protein
MSKPIRTDDLAQMGIEEITLCGLVLSMCYCYAEEGEVGHPNAPYRYPIRHTSNNPVGIDTSCVPYILALT